MKKITLILTILVLSLSGMVNAQISTSRSKKDQKIDYANPQTFEVMEVNVSGTKIVDKNAIRLLAGIEVGTRITIPGNKISNAIKNMWKQGLFSDVTVYVDKIEGDRIWLRFDVKEQPRMSRFQFRGVSKSEADDLREKIKLYKEKIITENVIQTTKNTVKAHFVDKGFYHTEVQIIQKNDTIFKDHVLLIINVDKKQKIKIDRINVNGNDNIADTKIRKAMAETKEKGVFKPFNESDVLLKNTFKYLWKQDQDSLRYTVRNHVSENIKIRIFKSSKFLEENFENDKLAIVALYNSEGYRDAQIVSDSIYDVNSMLINIDMNIEEGKQYYFRNINFVGNTKYTTEQLRRILDIEKGDIYNSQLLDERLNMSQTGLDISSLYMDDGYLFFQVNPVETSVVGDSIDLEIRIQEGQQATVNDIIIRGNTKTNEHVIRREIRTKPGELFSRTDIIRSQRELAMLGYFDPENMNIVPAPNPANGTVDITYEVAEKPSDQIELSGGWGGGNFLLSLGLSFTNFSMQNFFNKEAWTPLPSGDGQRFSIRAQSNGAWYQNYSLSFTEPWLGGRKPNALTTSVYYSLQNINPNQEKYIKDPETGKKYLNPQGEWFNTFGVTVGLGKRLTWPDDYFTLYQEVTYQRYDMQNADNWFEGLSTGFSNNMFYKAVFSRSSIDDPNFPKKGSQITFSAQFTPPYSLLNNKDYSSMTNEEKFKFAEYQKYKFTSAWYTPVVGKEKPLVLYTKVGFGFLAPYSREVGQPPFERFLLGGSGLTGYQLNATEIIALRGYDDQSLSPQYGSSIVTKYTAELRYPLSLNPSAMIYALAFVEAGKTWDNFEGYDPFDLYRSGGFGVRVFMPMFGMLGLDWGHRFDDVPYRPGMQRSQVHFTIGTNLGEL